MRRTAAVLLPVLTLALAACSDDPTSADAVKITATDSRCEVSRTALTAGKNTFEVTNDGSKATEVYVYAPGDKVLTEKENIGPGTSATFSVELANGTYEIACKPGQTGNGIRKTVTVTGGAEPTATAGGPGYDREIEFSGKDYVFDGLAGFTAKAGEKIEFTMANKGTVQHEFEVSAPDGTVLGEIGPTDPGKNAEVIVTLATAGTYKYICGVADHEARGMKGTFTVTAAAS